METIVPSLRELMLQPDKQLVLTQPQANTKGKRQQKAGDRPKETTTETELSEEPGDSTSLGNTDYEQSSRMTDAVRQPNSRLEKQLQLLTGTQQMAESEKIGGNEAAETEGQENSVHDVMNQLADKLEKLSADLTTSILENQWGTSECQRQLMSDANSLRQQVEEFNAKITELLEYEDGETDDSFSENDRMVAESDSDWSERSIPSRLEVQIDDLCKQVGVSGYTLHQNAEKETAIEIFGIDVETKLETELKEIRENWKGYELTTRNQIHVGNSTYIHQFVDSDPVFGKYKIEAREWKCGLIVKARDRNNQTAVFAVGPAHMLFDETRNQGLQEGKGLDVARENVRHNPPQALYVAQFTINEGEESGHLQDDRTIVAYVEKGSGPLLGYRYKTEPNTKSFLNDVVLLRLRRQDSIPINGMLEKNTPGRRPRLVNVYEERNGQRRHEVLKEYVFCNGKKIKVRNDYGEVVANHFSVRRQTELGKPFRLMFKLDSGKLAKGDSGLIVYEVRYDDDDTELLYPLAMVVGSPNEAEGYEEGVYMAAFLQQAFDDIEHAYRDEPTAALTRIEPYSRSL